MKNIKPTIIALALALSTTSLTGCVVAVSDDFKDHGNNWSDHERTQKDNRKAISTLDVAMTLEAIQGKMGVPDFSELHEDNGETVRVLFYRTHKTKSDGKTTKDECTPLVFKDGKLTGWGETAYKHI